MPNIQLTDFIESGIDLNLRNPTYSNGTLKTTEGGIVRGSDIRIQAQTIEYLRKKENNVVTETVTAEGCLMVEFGDYIFIGERIEYDIQKDAGIIYNGKTSVNLWYFGGERIQLLPDKTIVVHDGFTTTSPGCHPEWAMTSDKIALSNGRFINAKNVKFKILNVPLFWLPKFQSDLKSIFESPITYGLRFGGKQGPRIRMMYEIFSWYNLKTFFRFEYRLNRGPGGGFITHYHSPDHNHSLETINYVARDSSIDDPDERFRYRFQGVYHNFFNDNRTRIRACWDKLSDKDMPEDYHDDTLRIDEAGRTELLVRHQENAWIANLMTRVQLNSFQTVKQELPSLEWRFHPYVIGSSGVVSDTLVRAGYLDYDYANSLKNVHDYSSTRFEFRQNFYRAITLGSLTITPNTGIIAMYYGNSPIKSSENLLAGLFSVTANMHMYRFFGDKKHVLEPYILYRYYTSPTVNPDEHFIFDIEDGWFRLNTVRFGFNNNVYYKSCISNCVHRYLQFDIYGNAFIDTDTVPEVLQKVCCDLTLNTYRDLKHIFTTAWNFQNNQLDHFNYRLEWTVSANLAIATEFRHRGPFDWRKADYSNYILDSYRTNSELRTSALSDRRDTLLFHTYYRFHPYWVFEFEMRKGWNRRSEPDYLEYQTDLTTNLGSAWNLRFSYQHRENDQRVALYFTLGAKRPNRTACCPPPCVEF
ncbi:MAG: hypothetical protein VX777_08410 [Chlamydiota bacterium]|nr:hypothetical protein [Chlamydiota bacterium]